MREIKPLLQRVLCVCLVEQVAFFSGGNIWAHESHPSEPVGP